MSANRAAVCALLVAVATGCGQASPEASAHIGQAIYNGYPSGPEDDGVVKVASVDASNVTNNCTGALVAPNVLLTARHCVSNITPGMFTCTDAGEITPDSKGGRFGALIDPANIKVYVGAEFNEPLAAVGAKVFATQTPSICRNDLATVVLDREITGVPILPIRLDRGNQRGERIRAVGFGETENSTRGVRYAKDNLAINQVGTSQFLADGDPIPPRTFLVLGAALCVGDSGGPALTKDGAVTGVYSQLGGACDSLTARQYFTQVAPFTDEVLTPAFELAGYEPIAEGAGPSEGSAGAAGTSSSEDAGAPPIATAGSDNGSGGSDSGTVTRPPPPGKGGCRCATTATPQAGWFDRLAVALALGTAVGAVSRRRRRRSERTS